jgi:hypothetical protein
MILIAKYAQEQTAVNARIALNHISLWTGYVNVSYFNYYNSACNDTNCQRCTGVNKGECIECNDYTFLVEGACASNFGKFYKSLP